MHNSVSACYEARIRGLQAFLCSNACEPLSPGAARIPIMASASCGWHSGRQCRQQRRHARRAAGGRRGCAGGHEISMQGEVQMKCIFCEHVRQGGRCGCAVGYKGN